MLEALFLAVEAFVLDGPALDAAVVAVKTDEVGNAGSMRSFA